MIFRTTNASWDHQGFHVKRYFLLDGLFNNNFPCEYHNKNLHNPNTTLNHPEATSIEQVRHLVNKVSQLVLVMADQAIIKAAISSVETFDDNKNKFEVLVENAAWMSGQDIST